MWQVTMNYYGFLANVCYTLGWIIGTFSYRGMPRTRLYEAGVIFSMSSARCPVFGLLRHGL